MEDGAKVGDLVCVEFLLQKSLAIRLSDDHNLLATATAYTAAADHLLAVLDHNKRRHVSQMARLTELIAVSALCGTIFYYRHVDCDQSGVVRCCEEHRVDGYMAALSIIKTQLCKEEPNPVFKKWKSVAVHLASVSAVLRHDVSLSSQFISNLGELQNIIKTRQIDEIVQKMNENDYNIDIDAFEETVMEFMRKSSRHLIESACLVDRFSDLFEDACGRVGACEGSDSPVEADIVENNTDTNMESQVIKSELLFIPGEAFRSLLVSDQLLTSIIHKTDPKVSAFIRDNHLQDKTILEPSHVKKQRLTDRHDSAEQLDWATQHLVDAYDTRSAVNPAFTKTEPLHYLPHTSSNRPTNRNNMRRPWTTEEVNNLLTGYKRFGPDWRAIQQHYRFADYRSNVDLKDKYRNLVRSGQITE